MAEILTDNWHLSPHLPSGPSKRAEAKECDTNAIGVYVTHERPDADNYNSCWPCTDRTIALFDLLLTSKRWQSPYCNSYREEKEGGWACRTGEVYSLHARTKEREDFEERTEWKSVEIYTLWTENTTIDENQESAPVKINSHCWLKTDYSVFLSPYGNTRISYSRAALINFSTPRCGA